MKQKYFNTIKSLVLKLHGIEDFNSRNKISINCKDSIILILSQLSFSTEDIRIFLGYADNKICQKKIKAMIRKDKEEDFKAFHSNFIEELNKEIETSKIYQLQL